MSGGQPPAWAVVVPTIGRPSLPALLASLAAQAEQPAEVIVVDDRPRPQRWAGTDLDVTAHPRARVLPSGPGGGRGPAAARNTGWRAATTAWVVLLDDDVVVPDGWSGALLHDLASATPDEAAVSGRIAVPLPPGRRPTDWERSTAGLATAWWATADLAVRVAALAAVGGFDERFRRAYREDADLAARLVAAGHRLRAGRRQVIHPVRPADRWISVRVQRGNADDALMRALHGPGWRRRVLCPPGRLRWHAVTTAAGLAALGALAGRRRRAAAVAGLAWTALTADFARRRIAPGPRTRPEVATLLATSVALPPVAVTWRLLGTWWHRHAEPWPVAAGARPRAVLFDRDGTLIHDVPYNGDPALVHPVDGAVEALDRLRAAGIAVGLVTNQSGVGRGLITRAEADDVTARVVELLGPFGSVRTCPHAPEDGCGCRKPAPGLVRGAAADLGVAPGECVVVGDIGADVEAARAAGAPAVLVPTAVTRRAEVEQAGTVAPTLAAAVELILRGGVR
jgi:histidinol-phosphate phosphatase family protein